MPLIKLTPFATLFFLCPREGQQFPDAQVDLLLDGCQALLRQVDRGMPGKAEADQTAELVALLRTHDLPADGLVRHAVGIGAGLGVFRKVLVLEKRRIRCDCQEKASVIY